MISSNPKPIKLKTAAFIEPIPERKVLSITFEVNGSVIDANHPSHHELVDLIVKPGDATVRNHRVHAARVIAARGCPSPSIIVNAARHELQVRS
jgi:hypothetical protein